VLPVLNHSETHALITVSRSQHRREPIIVSRVHSDVGRSAYLGTMKRH